MIIKYLKRMASTIILMIKVILLNLKKYDKITLRQSSFVNQRQNKVYIGGEVIYPGNYIILKLMKKYPTLLIERE